MKFNWQIVLISNFTCASSSKWYDWIFGKTSVSFSCLKKKIFTWEGLIFSILTSTALYYLVTTTIGVEPPKVVIQTLKLDIEKDTLWIAYYFSYLLIPIIIILCARARSCVRHNTQYGRKALFTYSISVFYCAPDIHVLFVVVVVGCWTAKSS